MALLVQVRVWLAVRSDGNDDEHNDFKVRTEERLLEQLKKSLEAKEALIAKLHEAHEILAKEKRDVQVMRNHEDNAQLENKAAVTRNPLHDDDE